MSLKRITDKNFPPPRGSKVIPVYAKYFNDAYDVIEKNDAKDHHSMDPVNTVKHSLMAVAVYDYSVNGGATGTVNLNDAVALLPDNALIQNVSYDIQTAVVATGATAGIIFKLPTDGNLLTIDPIATTPGTTGAGLGTPLKATANTWVKTTAARGVQLEVTGAGVLNAGKVYCFIEYVVSELDASSYVV
jgi:hypothetical protein